MSDAFAAYITQHETLAPKRSTRIAVFCHFDAHARIARYVVHAVKSLAEAGADVYFISNNEAISDAELEKIRPFASKIVLRKNVGYDFAAYFTGYDLAKDEGYEHLIFANDSVYGPFYPLTDIFEKMADHDMWGITDAYAGTYHMQSYFWVFKLGPRLKAFLNGQLDRFVFSSEKGDVVERYEIGITQALLADGFNVGAFCSNARAVEIESSSDDPVLKHLKGNIANEAGKKINLIRRMRGFLSADARRGNAKRLDEHGSGTGIFSAWYALIKYTGCPFIKVRMLKSPKMAMFHERRYVDLLREKYPAFDPGLIEDHLQRGL